MQANSLYTIVADLEGVPRVQWNPYIFQISPFVHGNIAIANASISADKEVCR